MSNTQPNDQVICDEMVTKIAALAKLRLTPKEADAYRENFKSLMKLFHQLDDLPFDKEEAADLYVQSVHDCREDHPQAVDNQNLAQATPYFNPQSHYFDVPQFIEYNDE